MNTHNGQNLAKKKKKLYYKKHLQRKKETKLYKKNFEILKITIMHVNYNINQFQLFSLLDKLLLKKKKLYIT